ncbi:MAG: prolyl oligopeptidase family serine peptidase, partial [Bacteroidota bacterium]|nr:prolyl oligopeptidase family serine peptidase [Bacteroidota bacterium]
MKQKLLFALLFLNMFAATAQTTVIDSIYTGGMYRSYRIYVPASYTGSTVWPLIFNLHGYTSTASAQQSYSNFMPIADTANFLMVFPQGTSLMGQPYWNAGLYTTGVDDIQFLSELIDSLSLDYMIDQNRVYSCGMSNGGYMSQTLACALSSRIAAIASVTGSIFTGQYATCAPGRPVPVMQISGNADGTVPYNGSSTSLHIDTVVKYWVENNNCNPTAAFTPVPNTSTTDGCTAEHYVYSGGVMGSSVELYKIIGGGHTWPGSPFVIGTTNQDFKASDKIWLFFRKYTLNQFVGMSEENN